MVTKAEVKKVMSALGKKTSPAKAAAARRNAKLGGRPRINAIGQCRYCGEVGIRHRSQRDCGKPMPYSQ